ncbi:MAG: D-alanyl-D-alanine carboxypeptidase family protein [Bacillota bacterium]
MKLKQKLIVSLIVGIVLLLQMQAVLAQPDITAQAGVVIDVKTGEVLFSKDHHQRRPPASTTKIMTGILAIENGDLEREVTISQRAAYTEGSSIWLETGESLTLRELIYGLLLNSGNDAAVAIAEEIGGSVEEFAQLMNRKAQEIGALNTTFQNPNGLPQQGHLTTAYDLAMIARYALQNELFGEIVNTVRKSISWEGHQYGRSLLNTNRLLRRFDKVDGVKTGYTDAAGRCLVSSASENNRQVVAVVLKSNQMWHDSMKLLNYGLDNFKEVKLIEQGEVAYNLALETGGKQELELLTAKDFSLVIPQNENLEVKKEITIKSNYNLPITEEEELGKISFYVADELKGRIPLLASQDVVAKSRWQRLWQHLTAGLLGVLERIF